MLTIDARRMRWDLDCFRVEVRDDDSGPVRYSQAGRAPTHQWFGIDAWSRMFHGRMATAMISVTVVTKQATLRLEACGDKDVCLVRTASINMHLQVCYTY